MTFFCYTYDTMSRYNKSNNRNVNERARRAQERINKAKDSAKEFERIRKDFCISKRTLQRYLRMDV